MISKNVTFTSMGDELASSLDAANVAAARDPQLTAFLNSQAITEPVTFGVQAAGDDTVLLFDVKPRSLSFRSGHVKDASFVLSALPEQWVEFFKQTPTVPYQSFWGVSESVE